MKSDIKALARDGAHEFSISISGAMNWKRGAVLLLRAAALVCISAVAVPQIADAITVTTVHQFGDPNYPNDGTNPLAGVTSLNSHTLWGVACFGGPNDKGAIYKLRNVTDATPEYTVRYTFNGSDGYCPHADLLSNNGAMYGTTEYGGRADRGTIYSIHRNAKRLLYSFGNAPDGARPYGKLSYYRGQFWGTTTFGGNDEFGTLFLFDGTHEIQLHRFVSSGYWPLNGLTRRGSYFYGTTSQPCGTAFKVNITTHAFTQLHEFQQAIEGCRPYTKLHWLGGFFYGALMERGADNCGALFKMTTDGIVTVLHSFNCAPDDGDTPAGDLAYVNGKFYGATQFGGLGYGTIFEFDPKSLSEAIDYEFKGGSDGAEPRPGLHEFPEGSGIMWGTTIGGSGQYGGGTLFRVSP